ncbi:MAG: putative lipid II flippase FtsW [Puniceicoccales bacterium]|nr:putative lipid II flippase FtsW [Puniceicoccales bacterium]
MRHKRSIALIVLIIICINGVGLVALMSAAPAIARAIYLKKQVMALFFGVGSCALFSVAPLSFFFRWRHWLLAGAFGALILVLIPGVGHMVNGSRRWIHVGSLSLQISEFAKIPFIIWLAGYVAGHREECATLVQGFLKPMGICGSLAFAVLCEPDYGTAFLLMIVALAVLFLFGARLRYAFFLLVGGGIIFLGLIALNPNRWRRIVSFFAVEECRFDATYQLWQGILCFASGGLWGSGIGLGRQKLSYLPEAHTDFIFPVIGEEWGGIFAVVIILAFLVFVLTALLALYPKEDVFIRALGIGAVLIIALQAIINIAVVTGCFPTKGMALPFISYGGSNLVAMYALLGLIINGLRSEGMEGGCRREDHKKIMPIDWLG